MTTRRKLVAGNWKMNLLAAEAEALAQAIGDTAAANTSVDVAVAPPAIWIERAVTAAGSALGIYGQNVSAEASGAFTADISAAMLQDAGAAGSLVGHSERRHVFGETLDQVAARFRAGVASGLDVILCVGEQLADRKNDATMTVVEEQLSTALEGFAGDSVTIAYEPVWAIGTGETASPQQAQDVHAAIRAWLSETFSDGFAQRSRILYGGSVKPGNAAELMNQADIDGVLVGGASLKADSFGAIIEAAASI